VLLQCVSVVDRAVQIVASYRAEEVAETPGTVDEVEQWSEEFSLRE
jgi:hypothetical protein